MASLNKKLSKRDKENLQRKKNISKAINTKPSADIKPLTMYEDGKPYTLNIDQIDLYDKNPRITKNPEYDAIYASLKADGFNKGALDVTQRPDDDPLKVFVKGGGNTTLSILKNLYEETGDNKYFTVTVIYRNWVSEYDCLASHHKENHLRGGQKYIEDALAILQMKEILEKETDTNLSDNEFLDRLKETSIPGINKPALTRMRFTVERLWPVCPEILKSGLTDNKIRAITKLEKHASTLHDEYFSDESPDDWDNKFNQALAFAENNFLQSGIFDYKELYYAVLDQLENDQVKRNRLDFILDGLIKNKKNPSLDPDLLVDDNSSLTNNSTKRPLSQTTKTHKSTDLKDEPPSSSTPPASSQQQPNNTNSSVQHRQNNTTQDTNDNGQDIDLSKYPIGYGDTEMLVSPGQQEINRLLRGEQYDSGLVAAKSTVNTDGIILHKASAHQIGRQWDTFQMNHDDSVFNEMPISCHDVREYAPLPEEVNELRQIMFDKAYYFAMYANNTISDPLFRISPIDSGAGFVLDDLPNIERLHRRLKNPSSNDVNPRTEQNHKISIAWWVLLGFTDMVQLNHLQQFELINKYQPNGQLKDILLHPMTDYFSPIQIEIQEQLFHSVIPDLITLFVGDATSKQLQLFIELQLTFNRLMKATNQDIWSSTGRGVEL